MTLLGPQKKLRRQSPTVRFLRSIVFWRTKNRRIERPRRTKRLSPARRSLSSVFSSAFISLGLVGLFAAVLFAARFALLHSSRFALSKLVFSPTKEVSADRLRALLNAPLGSNLIRLDTALLTERLKREPWLREVRITKRLPSQLEIEVTEHKPVALLALNAIYLMNADGEAFRRAAAKDYTRTLPIITGMDRSTYLLDRDHAKKQLLEAGQILSLFAKRSDRPRISEVHIDRAAGFTLRTANGTSIRLGLGKTEELLIRLRRFDAVWADLTQRDGRDALSVKTVLLDNRAHPEHVIVRLGKPLP